MIVKARIPVPGPDFLEGRKAGYRMECGDFHVWFNDGTEIPA